MEAKITAIENGEIQIDLDEEMADALSDLAKTSLGENSTEEQQDSFIKDILKQALHLAMEKTKLENENKAN